MNRKAFLSTIAAIVAAPFIKEEKPEPELPKNRPVEVADVEKYVNETIEKRLAHYHQVRNVMTIKGEDLFKIYNYKKS